MEILNEIDWTYIKPNANKFIENQENIKKSCIYRLTNDDFFNPLLNVHNEQTSNTAKKKKQNINKPSTDINHIVPTRKKLDTYIPGLCRLHVFPQASRLTPKQHEICNDVLRSINDYCYTMPAVKRNDNNLQFYNNLIPTINEEQKLFMEYVKNIWDTKGCAGYSCMKSEHENLILDMWKKEIESFKNYPRFYEMATMLPLVYSNSEVPIELVLLKSLEDTNTTPLLKKLTLNTRYILPVKEHELKEKFIDDTNVFKTPTVSQDMKCEKFAIENRAQIVISASGLQTLADNHPPYLQTWRLPILVKEHHTFDDSGNRFTHTIAYIDQALPPSSLSEPQKVSRFYNLITKSNFVFDEKKTVETKTNICDGCKKFALRFNKNKMESVPHTEVKDSPSTCISDDSDDEKLIIDDTIEDGDSSQPDVSGRRMTRSLAKIKEINSPKTPERIQKRKIFDQHCACEYKVAEKYNEGENVSTFVKKILETNNIVDEDVREINNSYKLWRIGQSKEKIKFCKDISPDITVLVRTKTDACELNNDGTSQPYVIAPKLEFQWEFGAEIITPSEAITQWTALKFRPDSKLLRARILPRTREVCMLEKLSLQAFAGEVLKRTSWKPEHGLGCYFNIFSKLINLRPGQYILNHEPKHHAFALLYNCVDENRPNGMDLENVYKDSSPFIIDQNVPWIPIDPMVVTTQLYHQKVMPCMFTPGEQKILKKHQPDVKKGGVNKGKKNKGNRKSGRYFKKNIKSQ